MGRVPLSPTALTTCYRLGSVLYALGKTYLILGIFYLILYQVYFLVTIPVTDKKLCNLEELFCRHKKSGVALDFVLH